jgi:hypothetical protein
LLLRGIRNLLRGQRPGKQEKYGWNSHCSQLLLPAPWLHAVSQRTVSPAS